MAPLCRDTRRLQTTRPGAHDHHTLPRIGRGNHMRHRKLAARGRVVDAQRFARLIDAVQTIGRPDTGPDIILAPRADLLHDHRIGHMRPRHADHIQQARRNGMPRGGDIGNARGVKRRHARLSPHAPREIEVRRTFHALHRDHIRHGRIGMDLPPDHVQEIHLPAVPKPSRNLQPLRLVNPALGGFIGGISDTDDKLRPDPVADRVQHHEAEPQPVLQIAAKGRVHPVRQRRPELIDQMAIGLQLDPIQPCRLHPLCRIGVIGDDPVDVEIFHLLRKSPMRRFAQMRRRKRGQPVALVPSRPTPEVRQLDHHRTAVFMAGIGQFAHPAHHFVLVGKDIVEHRRAVAADRGGTRRHRQRHTRPCTHLVISAVALFRHPVFGIGGLVTGCHHPVLQGQMLQPIRLQKRIATHADVPLSRFVWRTTSFGITTGDTAQIKRQVRSLRLRP